VAVVPLHGAKRRRTYAGEELWFPLLEDFGPSALRRGLIGVGVSPQVAGGLVWFLEDQLLLARTQTDHTRTRYRRVLAELDPAKVARAAKQAIPGLFNSPRSKVA